MATKYCTRCGTFKDVTSFSVNRRMKDGLYSYCRACKSLKKREYKYGLPARVLLEMLKEQNNRCAIDSCGKEFNSSSKEDTWHVDHVSGTNKVRALLCNRCNRVLGLVNHDIHLLDGLAVYMFDFGQ